MTEPRQLHPEQLFALVQVEDLDHISYAELERLFRAEEEIADFRPDGTYQIDPRNGDRIVFNTARSRRPHDNRPEEGKPVPASTRPCVVCQGRTTGIIDVAPLSEGFTFINKNLFPILYPFQPEAGVQTRGLHLLQWTSSLHDRDWHNMPLADRVVVLERLAALEHRLLESGPSAHVSLIKNYGHLVGGSLEHGHQQILLSDIAPRRLLDNQRFRQERDETFAAHLLRENPPSLLVRDYGPALLLVPYFMRRPYDMYLLLKETERRYLHQLTPPELVAVAEGWHDAIRAMRAIMPRSGRELAYNVVTHTGAGAGLYFEFLPYTQEIGGYEHLGLYICQGNPQEVAATLRAYLESGSG